MKYCKKCMQMDTRYGLKLDENQICGGCHYHESLDKIDWNKRKQELADIIENAKKKAKENGSIYDCCIGVSGGKDSTLLACYLKENFDANILLINCSSTPITEDGKYNIENLRNKGLDMLHFMGDPITAKKLALYSFEQYGHICKPLEHLIFSTVTRVALNFKIPLIVMGENGALVWGTSYQKADDDWFGVINTNTNDGILSAKIWEIEGIDKRKLDAYRFPDLSQIKEAGIRAIFLQYYIKQYGPVYNADFSVARGMRGRYNDTPEEIGRYRIFSSVDDDLMIVNEMLKYLKNGFGRASDDVVDDLRNNRITWDEGVKLIEKFDGLCGQKYIKHCCEYLEISEEYFWQIVDKHVNKKLFKRNTSGSGPRWERKFKVGEDYII